MAWIDGQAGAAMIILLWVLLLPGVGWAEKVELLGDPQKTCWVYIDHSGGAVKEGPGCAGVEWLGYLAEKGDPVVHYSVTCYRRMQEAMHLADAYFRKNLITSAVRADDSKKQFLEVVPLWAETMRDCVKGKP